MSGQWQPDKDKHVALEYRGQAEGAIPNGATVQKVNSADGDTHKDGALGTVIGSMGPLGDSYPDRFVYCVQWLDLPGVPVWIIGSRVREVLAS